MRLPRSWYGGGKKQQIGIFPTLPDLYRAFRSSLGPEVESFSGNSFCPHLVCRSRFPGCLRVQSWRYQRVKKMYFHVGHCLGEQDVPFHSRAQAFIYCLPSSMHQNFTQWGINSSSLSGCKCLSRSILPKPTSSAEKSCGRSKRHEAGSEASAVSYICGSWSGPMAVVGIREK